MQLVRDLMDILIRARAGLQLELMAVCNTGAQLMTTGSCCLGWGEGLEALDSGMPCTELACGMLSGPLC